MLQVNLNTCFTLARDTGRHMLMSRGGVSGVDRSPAETAAPFRGKIINVASLLSFQGGITVPAYAVAKVSASNLCGLDM